MNLLFCHSQADTVYGNRAFLKNILHIFFFRRKCQIESDSFFSEERIRPVKSTCPSTICPPRRSQKRSARSKFTGVPEANREKAVRRIVSGVTSQENVLPSKAITVRQVPLTAILSPAFVPSSTLWQAIVSRQELPVRSTF